MIMYSKVTKGKSKPTETTTGNRNVNNIITLILNTHGTVQQKSNATRAQSIIDIQYTWHVAAESVKCQKGTVYRRR